MASSLANSVNRKTLVGLDGLRAIAVSLVVLYHFDPSSVNGAYGVMLFFVLSGFLITRLLLKERRETGAIDLSHFYYRRALRIFPAFYVYWLGMVAALLVANRAVPWSHAWSSFFYVSNYYSAINGDPSNSFSHTWSLAIEEQFYLLWPFALILLFKLRKSPVTALVAAIAAIWILRVALVLMLHVDQAYLYASFETRADALLIGCLTAVLIERPSVAALLQRIIGHWSSGWFAIAAVTGLMMLGDRVPRDTVVFAILPLLLAAVVLHPVAAPESRLTRLLEWAPLRFMGRLSYGIYLYQQAVVHRLGQVTAGLPYVVRLGVVFGVVILLATVSYYVVERPFLQLKARRVRRVTPQVQPAVA